MPWLFSYGTLQEARVQQALFGRVFSGRPDALPGYTRGKVPVVPGDTLNAGLTHYENVVATGRPVDRVDGAVLEVTKAELLRADDYESPAAYARVEVTLA